MESNGHLPESVLQYDSQRAAGGMGMEIDREKKKSKTTLAFGSDGGVLHMLPTFQQRQTVASLMVCKSSV